MSDRYRVHPLTEPASVEIPEIERRLDTLWIATAANGESLTRAAALNVIYAVHRTVSDHEISSLISDVSVIHPARWIVIRWGDPDVEFSQSAWVTAFCHRPDHGSPEICSEVIIIEVEGSRADRITSLVAALLLPGLPCALLWDASLPVTSEWVQALATQAQRVITAAVAPCSPWSDLKQFLDVRTRIGGRAVTTDLIWSATSAWRERIAAQFDADPEAALRIDRVIVHFAGGPPPALMVVISAWILIALDWETRSVSEHDSGLTIRTTNAKTLDVLRDSGGKDFVAFELAGADRQTIRCEEPASDRRLSAAVIEALSSWGTDPVVERVFETVADWSEALLFPQYSS